MNHEGFYDFHTHTVFSDGGMIPAGLMQRAIVRGCLGLAITDHVGGIGTRRARCLASAGEMSGTSIPARMT